MRSTVSQKFSQQCLRNSSNVCLIDKETLSCLFKEDQVVLPLSLLLSSR